MRFVLSLLLFTHSFFAFSNNIIADTTFSIIAYTPTTICGNDSVYLAASPCAGRIVWSDGETTNYNFVNQAGSYTAFCEATNETSNAITVTIKPTHPKPTVSLSVVDFQNVLTASPCSGEIYWNNGSVGTSITVTENGVYYAFCRGTLCESPPSNSFNTNVVPTPLVSTNKTQICSAESAILTATGCTGTITWTGGLTGSSIQVSFAGTYSAYCSADGHQSLNSENIIISSIDILPPTIASSNGQLCLNPSVTLLASGCNEGTIIWNNGITATSIEVAVAGTYSAQCQNICGLSLPSNVMTIAAAGSVPMGPVISSTKMILCDGEAATLTAVGCVGSLIWNNNMTSSTIQITQSGTYSATCHNQCGSSPQSNLIIITTSPLPSTPLINSNKTIICNGETATLTATGCNGTLVWNNGMTTNSIVISLQGTYSALCQNLCGSSNASNQIIIRSSIIPTTPLITTNKIIMCDGEKATLTATGCNGTLQWSNGATISSIQLSFAGTYTANCQNICGKSVESNQIILKMGNTPTIPNITSTKTLICNQEASTLSASNCLGNIAWSNAKTGSQITVTNGGIYTAKCETICGISLSSNAINIIEKSLQCTPISIIKVRK
jgi:heme/copper-type cytochrome/quinol oxidase subunit 2